jgi:hypothetical protein
MRRRRLHTMPFKRHWNARLHSREAERRGGCWQEPAHSIELECADQPEDAGVVIVAVIRRIAVPMCELEARRGVRVDDRPYTFAQLAHAGRDVYLPAERRANLRLLTLPIRPLFCWTSAVAGHKERFTVAVKQYLRVMIEQDQRGTGIGDLLAVQ